MTSARDTDPGHPPSPVPHSSNSHDDARDEKYEGHANELERLERLVAEMQQAGWRGPLRGGLGRRRRRAESEAFGQAARRWSEELERLRRLYEDRETLPGPDLTSPNTPDTSERERQLERALAEREAELKALRGTAAGRELDLQREHGAEARRQQEEIASLKKRLVEAESGGARDEELREVKRLAYERERELRRTNAEKLSETEREAERRISALQAQREADNHSLMDVHAAERARLEEELQSLRLRRDSEARVYGKRIEELARERAEERTSLEEAVAKLREKHEAERARLQERLEILEEYLEEQESVTVRLLGELGYVNGPRPELTEAPSLKGELEVAARKDSETEIQEALSELRGIAAPGNLLREGLALFNETEHVKVVYAVSKSLGEPEVYAALEPRGGVTTPVITLIWPGMGWRRYVAEPRSAAEPKVYLAGRGEEDDEGMRSRLPGSVPNARLDGQGLLSLGVRPL